MISKILKMIAALIISVMVGMALLSLVYLMPVDPMKDNVKRSVELYTFEGTYPQWATGYKFTQLDNCTDVIMLLIAIAPRDKNVFTDSLTNPYVITGRDQQWQDLTDYSQNIAENISIAHYTRYWGGYLTVLKPLLLFFEVSDIRVINAYLQFALIIIMALLIGRKLGKEFIAPYMLLLLVMSPVSLAMSFQFSTAFYVMLITMYIMLFFDSKISDVFHYCLLFEMVGIVTNYVDFLTYPAITLGVPIVLYILMHMADFTNIRDEIIALLKISFSWALGYSGMWVSKWVCASLFTDQKVISSVAQQASYHTTESEWFGEEITRFGAIVKTLSVLGKWPYLLIGVSFIVYVAILWRNNHDRSDKYKFTFTNAVAFIFISLYPVVWFVVMFGHSYRCYWFAYREWGITAFAMGSLLVCLANRRKQ